MNERSKSRQIVPWAHKKAALWCLVLSLAFIFQVYAFTRAFWGTRVESAATAPIESRTASTSAVSLSFTNTISNSMTPPNTAPAGMAWIPGGEFSMGANDPPDMDEVGMKYQDEGSNGGIATSEVS